MHEDQPDVHDQAPRVSPFYSVRRWQARSIRRRLAREVVVATTGMIADEFLVLIGIHI
jgi:hypothetical protein